MLTWHLFGDKATSVFDVWSFEHLLSGISIGVLLRRFIADRRQHLLALGLVAFAWETLEHYLEEGLLGHAVELWFHGVEFWANRLLADPAMMFVGLAIANRCPRLALPARMLSLAWLWVHILVFPHSMYLQDWLSR